MKKKVVMLALILLAACPLYLKAETVVGVLENGLIESESGKKAKLAGLIFDEHGLRQLSVLLAGREVKLRKDNLCIPKENDVICGYMSFKATVSEFKTLSKDKEELRVGEFLIRIGAAQVDRAMDFERKSEYLVWEEEARVAGKGIWSYEEEAEIKLSMEPLIESQRKKEKVEVSDEATHFERDGEG